MDKQRVMVCHGLNAAGFSGDGQKKKPVLSPKAKANKQVYDREYQRKYFKAKCITFNTRFPEDIVLLQWVQQQGNGVQYIKGLIREDMMRKIGMAG